MLQQPFAFRFGALPLLVKGKGGSGAHRIAADKAQGQGGGTGAAHVEERPHNGLQKAAQIACQTERDHQGGEDEEGKQGGEDHVITQPKPLLNGGRHILGPADKGDGAQEKPGARQGVADPLLFQNVAQNRPPPAGQLIRRGVKL